ncbi:MAG: hypothetical protein JO307_11240 [Bryobacterales bacterium]|nr:hypothetical protein [Bryobacterales bacterium]MBV9399475.1 hypothetical protein [Bryobacterales bacterium]
MSVWFGASLPPEYPMPEHPGMKKPEAVMPPVPVIYETSEVEKMSLRVYAAVQLRVPESGIDWLDKMIERSRELDRNRA